jgi:hypothetical protein
VNSNERPGGFLMPELAPPPAGVRPFIARRPVPPAHNPNHVAKPAPAGESRALDPDWCYRCNTPGHLGEYACWVPIRPVPADQAVAIAAMAARSAAAVPMALAKWTPAHEDLIMQVAGQLMAAVDSSRMARQHLAGRHLWTRDLEDPLEVDE